MTQKAEKNSHKSSFSLMGCTWGMDLFTPSLGRFKASNTSLTCHSLLAVGVAVETGGVSMVLSGGGGGDLDSIGVALLS